MKALTGLSQAQFDYLLPVFSDIYQKRQPSNTRMKKGSNPARAGVALAIQGGCQPWCAMQFIIYYL